MRRQHQRLIISRRLWGCYNGLKSTVKLISVLILTYKFVFWGIITCCTHQNNINYTLHQTKWKVGVFLVYLHPTMFSPNLPDSFISESVISFGSAGSIAFVPTWTNPTIKSSASIPSASVWLIQCCLESSLEFFKYVKIKLKNTSYKFISKWYRTIIEKMCLCLDLVTFTLL